MQKLSTIREAKVLMYFLLTLLLAIFFTSKISAQNTFITVNPLKDITLNCDEAIPSAAKPIATTNCEGEGVLKYALRESTQGLCPKVIIRLWTITDPCGNEATIKQKIYIFDNTPPAIVGVPANVTVACTGVPTIPTTVSTKDKCDDKTQFFVKDTKYAQTCNFNYKIRRDFTAIDRCGNIQIQGQIITVQDNQAPVFTSALPNITVNCANVPVPTKPTVTDNCSSTSFISVFLTENRASLGCKDSYTIKRTWTAKDQCGKTATLVQMITVKDNEAPKLSTAPASVTLECNELVAAPKNMTATDNCDTQVDILFKSSIKYGTCSDNYQIIRVWTASDNCSNKSTVTQTITVKDSKAPTFSTNVQDLTVECSGSATSSLFSNTNMSAKDNCDPNVDISFSDENKTLGCSYILTRTYKATDNCNNVATKAQSITIKDSTPPTIANVPTDATLDCNAVFAAPLLSATDNCDSQVSVQFLEEKILGNCPSAYTLKRTWTATDKCGNKTVKTQNVVVNNTKAPILVGVPPNATINCNATAMIPAVVTAEGNCDKSVVVLMNEVNTPNSPCGYTLKRTWTATDNCGNSSSKIQTITVIDTEAPKLLSVPTNITVECDAVPIAASPVASDNCDQNVDVKVVEVKALGNCPSAYTLTRTWTATDKCGNKSTKTQVVTVIDSKKPIILNVPNNVTIADCGILIPVSTDIKVEDACDTKPTLTFSENSNTTGTITVCDRKITRTWVATDACGNSTSASQIITIQDQKAPVFVGEINDVTINCNDIPPANPQPTVTDNCDKQVAIVFKETTETVNCNTLIKRTWSATDICGNTAVKVQNITMIDTIKPVFQPIIADVTVECGTAPTLPNIVVKDNCDLNPKVVFKEEVVTATGALNAACNNKVLRIWTATDKCGNSTSIQQNIWIRDTKSPVFGQTPSSVTVDCSQTQTISKPVVTDNCTDKVSIIFKDEAAANSNPNDTCSVSKTRTWIATDLCGNTAIITQIIVITDKIAPIVAVAPKDVSISCSDTIPAKPKLAFFDACSPKVNVVYGEKTIVDSTNLTTYILERKWIATDRCGNAKVIIQNIYVSSLDIKPPVLITAGMPDQLSLECSAPNATAILQTPIFPKAVDDCDKNVTVTYTDDKVLETCGSNSYIILRTWKATDDAGNTDEFQQFFALTDTTPPAILNVPADITLACGETPPPVPDNIFAIDTCGTTMRTDSVEVNFDEVEYFGQCPNGIGQIKRFWTAVDSCDNVTNAVQVITFSSSITSKIAKNPLKEKAFYDKKEALEAASERIKVYPNPTSGTTYINLPKNVDMLLISNELGQIKYSLDNPREGINTVEMRDWNDGIYILQVKMQDKIQTQKVYLQTH